MARSNNQLGITGTLVDHITPKMNGIHRSLQNLDRGFGSLRARFMSGVVMGAGYRALGLFDRAITNLIGIIPDLIHKGQEWADTVDQISDVTGLSAQKASELAAVQKNLTGSTDGLGQSLSLLSRNLVDHQADYERLVGTMPRLADGSIDVSAAFDKLRGKTAELGSGAEGASLAAKFLGRGWRSLADILFESAPAWQQQIDVARQSGLVLTEAGAKAMETWKRAQDAFGNVITGLGAQIAVGVAPVLTSLVNGFSAFVQAHLNEIVRMVGSVVSFIAGLLGGLFGIDFAMGSVAGSTTQSTLSFRDWRTQVAGAGNDAARATSGVDALTRSLNRQIAAIGRQLAALDQGASRADERREHEQLLADISQARAELTDLRSQSIFAAGMSEAEAIMAQQAQAAAIVAGEKRVADAKRALRDHERQQALEAERNRLEARRQSLERELAAHQTAQTRMLASTVSHLDLSRAAYKRYLDSVQQQATTTASVLTEGMKDWATQAIQSGKDVANAIKDALFGSVTGGGKPIEFGDGLVVHTPEIRSGGLIKGIGDVVGGVKSLLDGMNALFGPNTALVLGLGAVALFTPVVSALTPALVLIGGALVAITSPLWVAVGVLGAAAAALIAIKNLLPTFGGPGADPGNILREGQPGWSFENMIHDWLFPQGAGQPWIAPPGGDTGGMGGSETRGMAPNGAYNDSLANWHDTLALGRYLGDGSLLDQRLGDITGNTGEGGAIADNTGAALDQYGRIVTNTDPIANGTVGVTNPALPDIKGNTAPIAVIKGNTDPIGKLGIVGGAAKIVTTGGDSVNVEGKSGGMNVGVKAPKSAPVYIKDVGGMNHAGGIAPGDSGGGTKGQIVVHNHITIDRSAMRLLMRGQTANSSMRPIS